MYMCVYVCVCMCVRVCVYVCVYVCMYVCVYTQQTHTHIFFKLLCLSQCLFISSVAFCQEKAIVFLNDYNKIIRKNSGCTPQ